MYYYIYFLSKVRVKIDEMIAAEKLKQGDIDSFTVNIYSMIIIN